MTEHDRDQTEKSDDLANRIWSQLDESGVPSSFERPSGAVERMGLEARVQMVCDQLDDLRREKGVVMAELDAVTLERDLLKQTVEHVEDSLNAENAPSAALGGVTGLGQRVRNLANMLSGRSGKKLNETEEALKLARGELEHVRLAASGELKESRSPVALEVNRLRMEHERLDSRLKKVREALDVAGLGGRRETEAERVAELSARLVRSEGTVKALTGRLERASDSLGLEPTSDAIETINQMVLTVRNAGIKARVPSEIRARVTACLAEAIKELSGV